MKASDFSEVINILAEYKEYRRMEKNKSERFKRYSDWENHMQLLIARFSTSEDLYNFKVYCMKKAREKEGSFERLFSILGIFLAVITAISPQEELQMFYGLIAGGMFLTVIVEYCWIGMAKRQERFFFLDVLNVVEKYEKSTEKYCLEKEVEK